MKKNIFLFKIALLCIILNSCTKDNDDIDSTNVTNYAHTPTSNNLIVDEVIGQSSEQNSTIYFTLDNGEGGVFFNGINNGNEVLGSMELNGNINWSRTVEFDVRGLTSYQKNGNEYLIAVGGRDFDGDDKYEEGRIILYDIDGNELDEESILHDDFQVWLNAVDLEEVNSGVTLKGRTAGVGKVDNVEYPYLLDFEIDLINDEISINLSDESNYEFFQAFPNKQIADLAGIENSYLSYTTINNGNREGFGMLRIDDFDVVWDKPLSTNTAGKAVSFTNDGLVLKDDILYLTTYELIEKPENNERIIDWAASRVFSISPDNGAINWETTINHSNRNDKSDGVLIDGNRIYVFGQLAAWAETAQDPDLLLGYGFVSVLNRFTGEEDNFHSFGKDNFQQNFNCAILKNNDLYLMGYTNYSNAVADGGFFDKWIVKVRKNDL